MLNGHRVAVLQGIRVTERDGGDGWALEIYAYCWPVNVKYFMLYIFFTTAKILGIINQVLGSVNKETRKMKNQRPNRRKWSRVE